MSLLTESIKRELDRRIIKEDHHVRTAVIDLLKGDPKPSDDDIHTLADKMGIDHHRFEEEIYALLSELINKPQIGKHRDDPDSKFDPNELKMGIEVEHEHTDCPMAAKEIAKDHLAECPTYYSRLAVMERECETK